MKLTVLNTGTSKIKTPAYSAFWQLILPLIGDFMGPTTPLPLLPRLSAKDTNPIHNMRASAHNQPRKKQPSDTATSDIKFQPNIAGIPAC